MKYKFYENNNNKLIIFFNGWGMDEIIISHLDREDYDLLILYDYRDVDLITATFGKALSSFGAFVVANKSIIEYLTNKARSFIFSTSIPPVNIM